MAESRNYVMQRSYKYESHDKNGKFNGLSVEDWKKKVLDDWTCDNLKANHVVIIFHSFDKDKKGKPIGIHAHNCTNFKDSIPQSNAMKLGKCSSENNCQPMDNKADAYRYLLHITEKAISEEKHIYSEDELIICVAKGKKFDYHKMIKISDKSEKKEMALNDKDKLKSILDAICLGAYGNGAKDIGRSIIRENVLLDEEANRLMCASRSNRGAIESAIELKEETFRLQSRKTKK